jgi:hypothetical protein
MMSALACAVSVGSGVDKKTANRYLKVGQRFGQYLEVSEWRRLYVVEGRGLQEPLCVDYVALANLPEQEGARIAIGYGCHQVEHGRSIGADFGALRWCFTTFALRVPPAFQADGPALSQAVKGWKKRVTRRDLSKKREKNFKSLVPGELMWAIIGGLEDESIGTRVFMATLANVFAYSRGKRGTTVFHCSTEEAAAEEKAYRGDGEEGEVPLGADPDPSQLGTKAEYHPRRGSDFFVLGRDSMRFDPMGLCAAFTTISMENGGMSMADRLDLLWERIGAEFLSMTTRSDKVGAKDKVYLYRVQDERGSRCPWGSPLSDTRFIRLMVKLAVLSDPMNPEDNLFSFRRSVVEAGEWIHSISLIVKKDVTTILKEAAAGLGLPPSAFAPHCYRHTYKTQQTMCAGILGAQTRETQEVMAKEWAAGSSAADGYVGDTAMGYDNLRTLSLGEPGTLVTLAEVRARLPSSLVISNGGAGR